MTEEAAPRIDEKPATHKKKLQLWLWISIGSVMVFLAVLTANNVYQKMKGGKSAAVEQAKPAGAKQGLDRQDQFEQLVTTRKSPTRGADDATGTTSPLEASFNKLQDGMPPAGSSGSKGFGFSGDKSMSETEDQKDLRKWKSSEELRALKSANTTWGLTKAVKASQTVSGASRANVAATATPSADMTSQIAQLNRPFTEGASLDQRRAEVKQRIEEAQKLRASLAMAGAAGIPQAGRAVTGIAAAGPGSVPVAPARAELKQVASGFDKPPADVVGYTKDNKYNADIAGKIKVTPGTVIETTLMNKAISDYMGSSLKAIVSHDVYDNSRQYVIFPKGTEINIGMIRTRNPNEAISNRVAFICKTGVLPYNEKMPNSNKIIDFSKATTSDREGVGAIEDQTDYHFMAQFLGVAAYALIGSGTSYSGTGQQEGSYAGTVGEGSRSQFAPLAQKYLSIVPTATIRPGQSFRVIIEDEMYVEPWSDLYAKYVD
jgi:type IV secretion system protein TrbI